jgi:hypothetical protein
LYTLCSGQFKFAAIGFYLQRRRKIEFPRRGFDVCRGASDSAEKSTRGSSMSLSAREPLSWPRSVQQPVWLPWQQRVQRGDADRFPQQAHQFSILSV